jgi:hypothetical protein
MKTLINTVTNTTAGFDTVPVRIGPAGDQCWPGIPWCW